MTHRRQRGSTSPMAADPIARPATAGTVELADARTRISSPAEDACGNDAPMEITERFPQPLGNLVQNAEISTFPQPPFVFRSRRTKTKDTDPNPRAPSDRVRSCGHAT